MRASRASSTDHSLSFRYLLKQRAPGSPPGLFQFAMLSRSSIPCGDRSSEIEPVVHADKKLFDLKTRPHHVRDSHRPRRLYKANVLVSEVHIVEFAEYRPVTNEHPFQPGADSPALTIDTGRTFRCEKRGAKSEDVVVGSSPGAATLHVPQQCRGEEISDTARNGEDILEIIDVKERGKRRQGMLIAEVAEIKHALHADNPPACKLIVATDLCATSEAAAIAGTEVIRPHCNTSDFGNLRLRGAIPDATHVAADVTSSPTQDRNGRWKRLDGHAHVSRRRGTSEGNRSNGCRHQEFSD